MQLGGCSNYLVLLDDMVLRAVRWTILQILSSRYRVFVSVQRGMNHRLRAFFRLSPENWSISLHMLLVAKPGKWLENNCHLLGGFGASPLLEKGEVLRIRERELRFF